MAEPVTLATENVQAHLEEKADICFYKGFIRARRYSSFQKFMMLIRFPTYIILVIEAVLTGYFAVLLILLFFFTISSLVLFMASHDFFSAFDDLHLLSSAKRLGHCVF